MMKGRHIQASSKTMPKARTIASQTRQAAIKKALNKKPMILEMKLEKADSIMACGSNPLPEDQVMFLQGEKR